MAVRDLEPRDFWQVVELYYGYYREVDEDPTRLGVEVGLALEERSPSIADEFAWFAEKLRAVERGDAVFKVAEIGERLVGTCEIARSRRRGFNHVGVLGIAVAREWRGRGVGRALAEAAIRDACGRRLFELIVLEVMDVNERAIRLYEKLGFVKYGYLPKGAKLRGRYFNIVYMYKECSDGESR
ncbi:Acetyltransferase, GNAT family [Thermoproteus tenax Kra 1]|uniref:Acetyltransferase, GNAT family n=1 Tax=Thermoproteus tenax (strain ATCC 35583 / DSM 2078 / JCM 9277 / NBRC 100435 / Kra 1) TaxID=768679 RepID=G4RJW0_THETK|nr:Acetyltransferase, GNAT family [Thermoproteus tenax Kra 1]